MRHQPLGSSGLVVSAVGLGCNNFGMKLDQAGTTAVVDAAIEAGISLFDTADSYGGDAGPGTSETMLGEALKGRRDEVLIATKFGNPRAELNGTHWGARGSRRYVRKAIDASLKRLRTDYVDLYQLHFWDGVTPLEETLAALGELVTEGKVRYLGSSNLKAWQLVDCDWHARTTHTERFVSAQDHYSLLERDVEAEVVPACLAHGIGLLSYFPLANGLLTGKYRRGAVAPEGTRLAGGRFADWLTEERVEVVESLVAYAQERGVEVLDVAIGGLAAQPAVGSVIAGATTPEQVRRNAQAGAWRPTAEDLVALDEVVPARRPA